MTEASLNASSAPATSAAQTQPPPSQASGLQNNQQYQSQSQAPEQPAQVAATTAAQAAAAAAAAVAAVGNNQNGHSVQNNNPTTEELACMWQGCTERFTSAEALYVSFFFLSFFFFLRLRLQACRVQRLLIAREVLQLPHRSIPLLPGVAAFRCFLVASVPRGDMLSWRHELSPVTLVSDEVWTGLETSSHQLKVKV